MWVSHFISLTYILMQTYNLQLFVLADWICLFLRLSSDQIQFYDQNSTFSSSCTQTSNIVSAFQINTSALNEIWFLQPDIQMKAELLLDIFGTSMRENIPTSEDVRWTMTALLCGLTYLCETAFYHMKINQIQIPLNLNWWAPGCLFKTCLSSFWLHWPGWFIWLQVIWILSFLWMKRSCMMVFE